ncbi:hypothetical protein HNQ64_002967 [Prosthecobacter dejongeii]|uniref:Uncharacterized protein n=1 Tax=Prosthecobacter dejongeii TaxID=48465 RepID=A0A7W8DQE0_9BACT|nr:hypothetical protein [Prosthecobacter dejongeii]
MNARGQVGRTGADLERTIIGRSSANEGEKTSPLSPLAGLRSREAKGPGVRGGGMVSRGARAEVSFEGKGVPFADGVLRAATTPHLGLIPASGEREGLLEARDGGGGRGGSRPARARGGWTRFWLGGGPGVLGAAHLHPRLLFFRPSGAGGGCKGANVGVIPQARDARTQNSARETRALHGGRGLSGADGITRRVMDTVLANVGGLKE